MHKSLYILVSVALLLGVSTVKGEDASQPRVLTPGAVRGILAGGVTRVDREFQLGTEGSLEIGIFPALTLAAPLALTLRVIETRPGSGLFISGGIADLYVTEKRDVFFAPSVGLYGQAILGPSSSFRGSIDLTSARRELEADSFGLWLRGSMAILIDFGPIATVAAGASYQRGITGGGEPESGLPAAGWVSDARVSFGAVRSQPYYDLPTLSIHLGDSVDVFGMFRFDVDLHRNTNDMRILAGLEIH